MADDVAPQSNPPAGGSGGGIGVVVVVVVILLAGLAFLAFSNKKEPATTIVPTEVMQAEPTGATEEGAPADAMEGEAVEITVTGSNFKFDPKEIRVKRGQKVVVTFNSVGMMHDFVIDELNVATKQLAGGQSETVEFTADQAGTFEYYCSVGNHRLMGMVGTLIVE